MFIQPDWFEVTKPGVGTNRYSYSFNDPVNKMDPGGNEVFDPSGLAGWEATQDKETRDKTYRENAETHSALAQKFREEEGPPEIIKYHEDAAAYYSGRIGISTEELAAEAAVGVAVDVVSAGALRGLKAAVPPSVTKVVASVCSFDGNTLVLTDDGNRPIRDIVPGQDRVWALDATGAGGWHVVLGQTVATYDHKVRVTIRDLEDGAAQTILSNRIHPYFAQVPEGEVVPPASEGFLYEGPLVRGHWIDAGHLKPGYRLLNPDGTWAEIVSVTESAGVLDAWNLTVEDAHTYFVAEREGVDPVWVHNGDCLLPTDKIARAAAKENGWVETNYKTKAGRAVFRDPKSGMYFTPDRTNHLVNGMWKGAKKPSDLNSGTTRSGTYDKNLNWIGK